MKKSGAPGKRGAFWCKSDSNEMSKKVSPMGLSKARQRPALQLLNAIALIPTALNVPGDPINECAFGNSTSPP